MDRKQIRKLRKPTLVDNTTSGETVEFVNAATGEPVNAGNTLRDDASEVGRVATGFDNTGDTGSNEDATGSVASENRFVDPATAAERPKRRYTRRATGEKNAPKAIAFATTNLEKVLFNLHTMGAAILAEPELVIDEDEAKLLAGAVAGVARAYDWSAMMSAKSQAALDLCIAMGTVYGVRVLSIMRRPKKRAHVVTMQSQPVQPVGTNATTQPGSVQ